MAARRSWRRCGNPRNLPLWPGRRRAPPNLRLRPSRRDRRGSIIRRREPLSVLQLLAERLVASAAAVLSEITEGRLNGGLVAALYGREEHVGLAHGVLLCIDKLIPIVPNYRFGREFPIRAGPARTRWKRVGYLSRRLGQTNRTSFGLRLIPLAVDIGLDAPEILSLPFHQGLAILRDRFLVLRR